MCAQPGWCQGVLNETKNTLCHKGHQGRGPCPREDQAVIREPDPHQDWLTQTPCPNKRTQGRGSHINDSRGLDPGENDGPRQRQINPPKP